VEGFEFRFLLKTLLFLVLAFLIFGGVSLAFLLGSFR